MQSACDAGASRDHLADDLGCDVGYLNGMMAAGDRRAPSAAHVIGLLLSPRVPEGAKRIVLEQMGVVAGVISHAKAGGLRKEAAAATTNPAAVAMTVGAETGDLARAIADAADARGDAGVEISRHEAKVIRREAGEAAAACARAGVTLGGVIDVSG